MTEYRYKVNPGGLMRCCDQSIDEYMVEHPYDPEEGTIINCKYCKEPIIFKSGAWNWHSDPLHGY